MNFFTNVNVQVFFILVIVTSLFIYYRFNIKRDISLLKTFFLTVSLITTTGFDTLRENEVSFVNNISILLTMIGGCIGSTTAGIKIDRIVDVFNSVGYYLKSTIYPRTVFNKQSIYGKQWNNSIHFAILYIMTICFAVLVFALLTGDGNLAMNLALGSITNSGILYEKSFEMLRSSCLIKSFFSIFMLLGRVEIIAILTFFIKR
jgi:trk system potassium uptake protein TrkH